MTQPPSGSHRAGPPDPDGRQGPAPSGNAHGWAEPGVPFPATPVGPPPGQPGGYSGESGNPARRPRKRTLLPWLIGAAVLLIAGLGTLLVFLLGGGDGERRSAEQAAVLTTGQPEQPARSSTSPVDGTGQLADPPVGGTGQLADPPVGGTGQLADPPVGGTGQLPGGARMGGPLPADEGELLGPGTVALTWVEAMGQGDFRTAYDLSCPEVQEGASAAAAADEDPAQVLGDYFESVTLGGQGFTSGTFDGIEHQAESATDMASFTLELDDGEPFLLLVHVDADGTVCDFY